MGQQYASRKGIWGWMLFDWASQPFNTLIVTFIFAPYFYDNFAETKEQGQAIWAMTVTIASLFIAATAPFLSGVAERTGPRKPWIFAFMIPFLIGCTGLWWGAPGMETPFWILFLYGIAFIGAEYMLIFANAMLPDLVPRSETGKLSGAAWGFGYLGGIVPLFVVLLFMAPAPGSELTLLGIEPIFGLDAEQGEPARATGPLSAIWFIVFVIPLFLWTPDTDKKVVQPGILKESFSGVITTVKDVLRHKSLTAYLASSMIYRDAMIALFAFGGIYADGVLGWGAFELGIFGILAAITGAIGGWFGGLMDKKFGPKPVVAFSIVALASVGVITISTSREAILFLPVVENSNLPDIIFFICGGVLGAASGSLQASSRTLLIHQAENKISMTEAFGLYGMSGKATAFIGPLLITIFTVVFNSQQLGVTPVIGLFIVGLIMLRWVKTEPES